MDQTTRAAELAAQFAETKLDDKQQLHTSAERRRQIVEEMLTFMPAPEVARTLGVTLARVGQIVGGVRK